MGSTDSMKKALGCSDEFLTVLRKRAKEELELDLNRCGLTCTSIDFDHQSHGQTIEWLKFTVVPINPTLFPKVKTIFVDQCVGIFVQRAIRAWIKAQEEGKDEQDGSSHGAGENEQDSLSYQAWMPLWIGGGGMEEQEDLVLRDEGMLTKEKFDFERQLKK